MDDPARIMQDSIPSLFTYFQEKISASEPNFVLVSHLIHSIYFRLRLEYKRAPEDISSFLLSSTTNVNEENQAWAAFFTGVFTKDPTWLVMSLELGNGVHLKLKASDVLAELHLQSGEADMAIARMKERVFWAASLSNSIPELPEWLGKAEFAFALFHLGRFYVYFGRFKEAADTCDRLGALTYASRETEILVTALHFGLCGHLASYMGDYKVAIQQNKQALVLLRYVEKNLDVMQVPHYYIVCIEQLITQANMEIQGAIAAEDRDLERLAVSADETLRNLENLCNLDIDESRSTMMPSPVPEASIQDLEKEFHLAMQDKRLEEAEVAASEMLLASVFRGLSIESCNALVAAVRVSTAWAFTDDGEHEERKAICLDVAKSFLDEAVNLSSTIPRVHRACLSEYGVTLLKYGLYAQAREKLERSLRVFLEMEQDSRSFGSFSRGRIAYLESLKRDFRRIQFALWKGAGSVGLGLVWAERGRSRDMLYSISNSRHELRKLAGGRVQDAIISSEFDHNDDKAWEEIRSLCALEQETVFLVYTQLEESPIVLNYFVHAREQSRKITYFSHARELSMKEISRSLAELISCHNSQEADSLLELLYELFISKWSENLERIKPKRLVIVAGEAVGLLPFAAFRDKNDKETPYLIQKYEIVSIPSLRVFKYCKERHEFLQGSSSSATALVVGNPGSDLHFAQEEAGYVAEILEKCSFKTTVLEREHATKVAILEQLETCDWAHFSSHGEYSESYPFGSLLASSSHNHHELAASSSSEVHNRVLNLTPSTTNQARITGEALLELKEDMKAKCVVLSACQTGLGESGAEGVLNLARYFHVTGVPAAVVSLWKVEDKETCQLMKGLYMYLLEGKEVSAALRASMLDMINEVDWFGYNTHSVLHWAPFLLSGAPSVTLY